MEENWQATVEASKMDFPKKLRVLLLQESDWFVAQCLEYDIAAQGKTVKDALYEFTRTLVGHLILTIEDGAKLEDIPPAPAHYWRWFEDGTRFDSDETPFRIPVEALPPAYMIPEQVVHIR